MHICLKYDSLQRQNQIGREVPEASITGQD